MAITFTIERSGRTFRAKADGGPAFFVGFQTNYTDKSSSTDFEGLYNVPSQALPKLIYAAGQVGGQYGFWADFIEPTARCEGGNYLTLNTYDRARFTWGFGQFGAHVANGDFVRFFRDLLGRPEAADYFPDLKVINGHVTKVTGAGSKPLEGPDGTGPLMDYLNPSTSAVEDAEVIAAAKLIHWTTAVTAARDLQALHMVGAFKRMMAEADNRLGLDGRTADLCLVVCDIRHQGRAKYPAMQAALAASSPLAGLLKLGAISYPDRISTLRKALAAAGSTFTDRTWSHAKGDFV